MEMNVEAAVIEIIAAVLGVSSVELPEIPVIVQTHNEIMQTCDSKHAVACFVAENGEAAVYIDRAYRNSQPMIGHEATHAAQWSLGLLDTYECVNQAEAAAYEVSNAVAKNRRFLDRGEGVAVDIMSDARIAQLATCQ
jgi:hypothetical protein